MCVSLPPVRLLPLEDRKALDPLGLQVQVVVSHRVCAGIWTSRPLEKQPVFLTTEHSFQSFDKSFRQ